MFMGSMSRSKMALGVECLIHVSKGYGGWIVWVTYTEVGELGTLATGDFEPMGLPRCALSLLAFRESEGCRAVFDCTCLIVDSAGGEIDVDRSGGELRGGEPPTSEEGIGTELSAIENQQSGGVEEDDKLVSAILAQFMRR